MWIITNLFTLQTIKSQTVEAWHRFVDEQNWTYYSVKFSNSKYELERIAKEVN